ncbi:MAG: isoprenylcysteine carboxylmethyltransferase family protein [Chloroflexi bacterium]|nr:isoprenylcysteine carboxylmethyltransferase family protein [Chloroflexota bacterium]
MKSTPPIKTSLIKPALLRMGAMLAAITAAIFLPAGTFKFWQAWVYLSVLLIPLILSTLYLLRHSPDLIERRMHYQEQENEQKRFVRFSGLLLITALMLPGFDQRFNWSAPPLWLILTADGILLLSHVIFFMVFRENRYASRVVEVDEKQTVVSSGPYAIVRHPMYVGSLLMYIFSPLALGSYWAMIPAAFLIPLLMSRIINEEEVLIKDLPGYAEYRQKVRYRLLPGVW